MSKLLINESYHMDVIYNNISLMHTPCKRTLLKGYVLDVNHIITYFQSGNKLHYCDSCKEFAPMEVIEKVKFLYQGE